MKNFVPVTSSDYVWGALVEYDGVDYVALFKATIESDDYLSDGYYADTDIIGVYVDNGEYNIPVDYSEFKALVQTAVDDMIPEIVEQINQYNEEMKWEILRQDREERLLSKYED